jgi:hypothetical protein
VDDAVAGEDDDEDDEDYDEYEDDYDYDGNDDEEYITVIGKYNSFAISFSPAILLLGSSSPSSFISFLTTTNK